MVTKSLSIPQELENFLLKHSELSPSKLLQSKIIEIRERNRIGDEKTERLERANKFLRNQLEKFGDKIAELEKKLKND